MRRPALPRKEDFPDYDRQLRVTTGRMSDGGCEISDNCTAIRSGMIGIPSRNLRYPDPAVYLTSAIRHPKSLIQPAATSVGD
jgi:hypothetical protein